MNTTKALHIVNAALCFAPVCGVEAVSVACFAAGLNLLAAAFTTR